jgi:uncharacterized protein
MLHSDYLDIALGPIGRVVTSEEHPATAHEFYFWTAETQAAQRLDIGHIVAAESEDATAIAVLDDPRRYSDLASFLDDFYARDGDAALEALSERTEILVFRARVLATKHREERKKSKRPVRSGPVYFATSTAIEFALGVEEFSDSENKIPMLLHENGNEVDGVPQRTPLYADADYLMGPEAGHLNITGMSGLSTKTSHALFTISSIFQTVKDRKVAALMFNVKGADLLFLDKSCFPPEDDSELAERYEKAGQRGLPQEDREMYEALGLEMEPFRNLRIFAPLTHGGDSKGESVVYPSDIPVMKLNTLRTARGEDANVHPIVWDLGDVLPHAGRIFDPTDYDDKFRGFVEYLISVRVESMKAFYGEIDKAFDYFDENEGSSYWNGHHQATIAKVRNRFDGLPSKCQGLLVNGRVDYNGSPSVEDRFEPNEMRVVDISRLSGIPQDLVVTKVVQSIWEKAERNELGVDKLIIFVDELNKYAPSGSKTSSLKDTLVDISARGRHLKLTLFGAQQFRSMVDDEVVGNTATSLYGRTGDEELTNASYRSFSQTVREELLQLEKGRLLLRHAHYAVPIFGRFPRPAVLMGAQGTTIFGQKTQDPATSVLSVMRNLTSKPPAIQEIRAEIDGVPEERVYEALDAVAAAHRSGNGSADPFKNFVWNLKKPGRGLRNGRDASRILSGLDRMKD